MTTHSPLLSTTKLHKHYRMGGNDLHVLRGIDLDVGAGEWLAVLGRSGSGKSTLLHLLGGLDKPGEGTVRFRGDEVYRLSGAMLDRYRNRHVGFVFQFYHLLPELTAMENVLIGAMISRSVASWIGGRGAARRRAAELLDRLGLADRAPHKPGRLSGGERQRVAIARALMNEPDVLLADEPTGNLDAETGGAIMDLFRGLHAEGQTIVMVTHDDKVAAAAQRRLTLVRGVLASA